MVSAVVSLVAMGCAVAALVSTHRALGATRSMRTALTGERARADAWREVALMLVDADDRPALLAYLCTLPGAVPPAPK